MQKQVTEYTKMHVIAEQQIKKNYALKLTMKNMRAQEDQARAIK